MLDERATTHPKKRWKRYRVSVSRRGFTATRHTHHHQHQWFSCRGWTLFLWLSIFIKIIVYLVAGIKFIFKDCYHNRNKKRWCSFRWCDCQVLRTVRRYFAYKYQFGARYITWAPRFSWLRIKQSANLIKNIITATEIMPKNMRTEVINEHATFCNFEKINALTLAAM